MIKRSIVHGNLVPGLFVSVLAGVFLLAPIQAQEAKSQTPAGKMPPGMSSIVNNAMQTPILPGFLTGAIPTKIPATQTLSDPTGQITTYQIANGGVGPGTGTTTTAGNGFFLPSPANGRTCFTCHQPQNDWEISPPQIQAQYATTQGKSVLFMPIDSAVCPNAKGVNASYPSSYFISSRIQLFTRGNFRISLNAPNPLGKNKPGYITFDGSQPQWILTLAYDPYGCEKDPTYGLPVNLLSVYRRPLNSANVVFLDQNPGFYQNTGSVITPEERQDIMWDAREVDLRSQFIDAFEFHGQMDTPPSDVAVAQGILFQSGLFTAQTYDTVAGDLTGNDGSGALGGPVNLYNSLPSRAVFDVVAGQNDACVNYDSTQLTNPPYPYVSGVQALGAFDQLVCPGEPAIGVVSLPKFVTQLYLAFASSTGSAAKKAKRASIARGEALFTGKTLHFTISNVAGVSELVGNPATGSCSLCHNNTNAVNDAFGDPKRLGIMDNSNKVPAGSPGPPVTVMPITSDFPRFAFYCPTGSIPYFSNPVKSSYCQQLPNSPTTCDQFITTDPGKGLITGKCADLGKMKVPILRGVGARAPYFHGGNAATLTDVVNFYNNRFKIGLTKQQKTDLVNYLSSL